MTTPSATHMVLIPSYNSGSQLASTVKAACEAWAPVCVIVDGSDDGSEKTLSAANTPGLTVLRLPYNQGKGAALLHGLRHAHARGYTHVLTMDADGQHPAAKIVEFLEMSKAHPEALVLGVPQFDASAPLLRVRGRRVSNWWANLETLWMGIHDSLFGFRVYPVEPLLEIMERTRWMRRFDFDVEAAVRLTWRGLPIINLPAPVRYLKPEEGGVSHFRYLRDNALLSWMHTRLLLGFLLRLPLLLARKLRR
ncbi:MAG: glycosyltransferase family 2 protein [Burkholderiales bacterium]